MMSRNIHCIFIVIVISYLFIPLHAFALDLNLNNFFDTQRKSPADATCTAGKTCNTSPKATCEENQKALSSEQDNNSGNDSEDTAQDTEQDIMESALALLEDSQDLWVKGDVEGAIRLLDQAYELMLKTNGDPDISRQKDDLRLLISKKILAIYTSTQTRTIGKNSEIPLIMNADVEKEIRQFQTVERDFFISSYQRSGLYRPMMVRELKKAGLPEELSWLPLVESGFKICALSQARALGLWQFIPSTGYKYGMSRDEWIDERMDAEKATVGAIGYMKDLHQMFGDWLTVLAAYNCGEGRVLKVIASQHINYLDRFWDLYRQLPYETARYVPRFLATLHIIKNPQKYGMDLGQTLERDSPYPYVQVKTNKSMLLSEIANKLQISEESLNILNAELRLRATPDREYDLKVPPTVSETFLAVMDEIPSWEKPAPPPRENSQRSQLVRHKVKKGQTLNTIAIKYGTSVQALRKANHLSKRASLKSGQILVVPKAKTSVVQKSKGKKRDHASEEAVNIRKYRVKKGDTLASLARRFDMSVSELKKMNNLTASRLKAGTTIKVVQ
jgi:membrane-bound lytic murein transglycosylase D